MTKPRLNLNYNELSGAQGRNRTTDTRIFNPFRLDSIAEHRHTQHTVIHIFYRTS